MLKFLTTPIFKLSPKVAKIQEDVLYGALAMALLCGVTKLLVSSGI